MINNRGKYKAEYAAQAAELALLGATDRILAAVFKVNPDTITRWKKQHPEFEQALLAKKIEVDGKVARSLYELATGYTVETPHGPKYIPPNVPAMIFWLKCRQPTLWREVRHVEHSGLGSVLEEIMNTSRGLPSAHPSSEKYGKDYTEH